MLRPTIRKFYNESKIRILKLNLFFNKGLTKAQNINVFYFIIDPCLKHPGLADTLKAIVSCYYIAKKNNYKFKIIYKTPFYLNTYLEENKIKWNADINELEYSIYNTKFFNYTGNKIPQLKENCQYHCYNYIGKDIFWHEEEHIKIWFNLYNELFKPSNLIIKALKKLDFIDKEYVTVHLRFVNLLENFEKGDKSKLSIKEKEILIQKCKQQIFKIKEHHTKIPIVVLSDSATFLNEIKDLPVIILDASNISHICHSNNKNSILKTFIDFHIMINAKYNYKIRGCGLYNTAFSSYAAYSGGKNIIEIDLT